MSSPKQFTVLLVPGSWHVPAHYESLIKALESKGITATTLLLPTCDVSQASVLNVQHPDLAGPPPSEPWPDMYTDAHAIRKTLSQLVDTNQTVLLVAHSYGGLPASEALVPDLCFKTRRQHGKPGGVVGFFAVASFFLPVGMTTTQAVGGDPLPATPEQPSGLHIIKDPHDNLFNDLPPPEQNHWTSLLRPQPFVVHQTPLKNAGYLNVPCAYLKTQLDILTPIQGQEMGIAVARRMGVAITEYTINGGHDAFLGQPQLCARDMIDFASKCIDGLENDEAKAN